MSSAVSAATQAPQRNANSRVRGRFGLPAVDPQERPDDRPDGQQRADRPDEDGADADRPADQPEQRRARRPRRTTSPATVPSTARRWRPGVGRWGDVTAMDGEPTGAARRSRATRTAPSARVPTARRVAPPEFVTRESVQIRPANVTFGAAVQRPRAQVCRPRSVPSSGPSRVVGGAAAVLQPQAATDQHQRADDAQRRGRGVVRRGGEVAAARGDVGEQPGPRPRHDRSRLRGRPRHQHGARGDERLHRAGAGPAADARAQGRAADRLGHAEHGERQARGERELRQRAVGQPHEQVHDDGGAERVQDRSRGRIGVTVTAPV